MWRGAGRVCVGILSSVVLCSPAAAGEPADVCLEFAPGAVDDSEWSALESAVRESLAARPSLFPEPSVSRVGARLDLDSGQPGTASEPANGCLEPGHDWSSRFGRAFLQAGAERMLSEAPTTPGIDSEVAIEWHPQEDRLRTLLRFAGPLEIPNGRCWIDDVLTIDGAMVMASGEQGVRTSPFAEGACGRFFDHLPDGGAGEQAVTLLPTSIELASGDVLRFVPEAVQVQVDALVVAGRLLRSEPEAGLNGGD